MDVLSNRRRRLVLELLRANGGEATARELSEYIATVESGENPPPRNIRQSAYVSLHQTHLPKLNKPDIIEYDGQAKTVKLNDRTANSRSTSKRSRGTVFPGASSASISGSSRSLRWSALRSACRCSRPGTQSGGPSCSSSSSYPLAVSIPPAGQFHYHPVTN